MKSFRQLVLALVLLLLYTLGAKAEVDICYTDKSTSGLCTPFGSMFCSHNTTLKSISSSELSDVVISKGYMGFSMSWGATLKIDGTSKTTASDNPDNGDSEFRAESVSTFGGSVDTAFGNMGGGFGLGGYGYTLGTMTTNEQHIISDGYIMSMGFTLPTSSLIATYIKNGISYSEPIPPCSGAYITISDANITEGDSGTKVMNFTVALNNPPSSGSVKVDLIFTTTHVTTDNSDYASKTSVLEDNLKKGDFPKTFAITVNGDTTIENNETFYLDIVIGTDNTMNAVLTDSRGVGTIIDDDNVSGGGGETPLTYSPGVVDVVDTYQSTVGTPFYQTVIKTKIAGKTDMTLDAVYLGSDLTADSVYDAADMPVFMYIYYPLTNTVTRLYNQINPNEPLAAVITKGSMSGTTPFFTVPSVAAKEAYILMKYLDYEALITAGGPTCLQNSSTGANAVPGMPSCVSSDVQYLDAFHQEAFDRCKVQHGEPCKPEHHGYSGGGDPDYPGYDETYDHKYGCYECTLGSTPLVRSIDNFAIRPEKLDVNSSHYDWANLLRAGQDYNTTINAYSYGTTTPTPDYNQTTTGSASDVFVITAFKKFLNSGIEDTNGSMVGDATWSSGWDFNMTNGKSHIGATGTDPGTAQEVAGIKFDDVGKITLRVMDQNWSAVDFDDTPLDCSANGAYICGDVNITYIPHHFDFADLNVTNNNGNPGTFTYIANEVDQMAGRIHTRMRALNADGNVTRNFATYPMWENNVTVAPVVTTSKYTYTDANETNISKKAINFSLGEKTIAWNENNNTQYLRFNFQRDVNLSANPFDVNGTDLNITITSNYIDASDGDTADINGSRLGTLQPADGNVTFVYGRVIARDVRIFGNKSFKANAWYEVFSQTPLTIGGAALAPSRNDTNWYIMAPHIDTTDGDANVTHIISTTSTTLPIGSTATAGVEIYNFEAETPPYSAKAHINTEAWLWYGINAQPYQDPSGTNLDCFTHPCFNINVVPAIGATGSATSEDLKSDKTNKATSTNPTGVIYDYSPAIR